MEQMNLQISQILQPTLNVQIVQNNAPVVEAKIVIGGGGAVSVVFGDTMTGTGTPSDPVNVSNDILEQIQNNSETAEENASQIQNLQNSIEDVSNQLATVQDVIPATASFQNQLADQGFVNSSIQTATAYFRGDWATWADVPSDPSLYPVDATGNRTPTTNDYMVVIADEKTNGGTWRYKYTGVWAEQGKAGWLEEYQVNETPFTAAQNAALNSGVTAQAVADIATNKSNITALQNGKQDKLTAGNGITIDGNTISASGGGASLPDQTGNAGKFLTTDGTTASWSDKPLVNTATANSAIGIGSSLTVTQAKAVVLGTGNIVSPYGIAGEGSVVIGDSIRSGPYFAGVAIVPEGLNYAQSGAVVVGRAARVNGDLSIAIGERVSTNAAYAIQLGGNKITNSDANTFKVGNANGNFEMMDADGNVPLERLTYVTNQIGDISTALTAILGE